VNEILMKAGEKWEKGKEKRMPSPIMGTNAASDCQVDSYGTCMPPLSLKALWRHYLRQEPSTLVAYAGICAEGAG